jgi:Rieske Fe-S protein
MLTLAASGLGVNLVLPVSAIAGGGAGPEKVYPIPPADGVNIDRDTQVMLVRYQGNMYAFSMACPHENAAVKWLKKDNRFKCTKHDSEYTPDGTYQTGHATRNLDRFPIRKDGANVIVSVDRVFRSDQNAPAWQNAHVEA